MKVCRKGTASRNIRCMSIKCVPYASSSVLFSK
ncbi:hypothetical protein KPSA3_04230 [Pseudomonas syringae pv. actinidiae]|uniref:Uncharacterized protein n=1 Tax=Pseudomonas syringae pv. actinidiae TaxID=103796 RepID=A0AAN4Q7D4_PSESF|nr:hypothetical protein KPSA3_04230 [Pseudomonas syringae pv. actinidiae]